MAKQKFPIQWILAFALTPVVIIVFVLYLLYGGGGAEVSNDSRKSVDSAIRHHRNLKPEFDKAMSDGKLTVNEANSIIKKANAQGKQKR